MEAGVGAEAGAGACYDSRNREYKHTLLVVVGGEVKQPNLTKSGIYIYRVKITKRRQYVITARDGQISGQIWTNLWTNLRTNLWTNSLKPNVLT